ncbi:MAG: hypothetical protein F4148_00135 [Caldilineaceae bacterium SB0675_bin_29]|uniref:Uncharacterized protein n=1 Tax=Caldilineaceae bacterium SB0675_bin_29 TaxID=2605266 RepID=A0A6B1FWB5_9CHLR|nr:hypothetical protein [Caldilineaceae bacterium SB0675_bin_29]
MAEDIQAQIDELKEKLEIMDHLVESERILTDFLSTLYGRFMFAREIIRRVQSIPPHISISKEEIDNLLPKDSKAKDAFIEELESFNNRRNME